MKTPTILRTGSLSRVNPTSGAVLTGTQWRPLAAGVAALAALALASSVRAASFYWTGDDNAFWNT
ncbi:MAG TPA: hypothetical protein VFD27_18745, partial [Chthoniobacteraceae bacterium]|nr:hypothetical protein [Chthoniobacteraceae bacterium]